MISKEKKAEIIATYGRTPGDTGSPEVQIAILTERIAEFEKVFIEQLNLSEILRNSGIRLAGASNSNENESPIKVR